MPTFTRDLETFDTADRIPVFPLRDVVVFPYVVMPLLVGRPASLAAIEAAVETDKFVLLVAQRSADVQEPAAADLYRTGVLGRILQLVRLPNGTTKVLVEGLARAKVTRYAPATGYLKAAVQPDPMPMGDEEDAQAFARRAVGLFEDYVGLHRRIPAEVVAIVQATESVERQAFAVAAHLGVRHETRQALLERLSLAELWRGLSDLLGSEIEILRLERKIDDDVRGSLFQNQREFYLQEQLKAIHRELGSEDDDVDELEAAIEKKKLPDAVHARAMREMRKLRRSSPLSPEATVGRNYLDWILALPWSERSDDVVDVAHARQILDEDHYGLEEVKERILDYIAVLGLAGKLDGPILCLAGPPGVGKTSLGRSIARALGRTFVRMSLGGVRDEAEIRGHRRTYIGSMPGRILQAMRRAETVNPVLLLDEIDKLGQDYRGDPSAALLEVLDPEQHAAFNDHYLEVDYDLSQVLFVTTANSLAGIPEPLRDRMEIIRLPGYLDHEKLAIARRHLVPRQLRANGIDPARVTWEPDVLPTILRGYTREAGVRELERRIGRVARKLARKEVELTTTGASTVASSPISSAPVSSVPEPDGPEARPVAAADPESADIGTSGVETPVTPLPLVVHLSDLQSFLGTPPYDPDDLSTEDRVGVVNGLAYTTVGGESLEIEVSVLPGRGKLHLTGTLGAVMKESVSAALSYVRSRAGALGLSPDFHRSRDIHVHMPAGATPKDGPSAGIAIATGIVSALTGVAVRGDVAMTGEITLRGRVLPIGGLKEKSVAAQRARVAHVLIPHGNARDLDDVPAEVRETVQFHPVKTMDEVLALALRGGVARAVTPTAERGSEREGARELTH